MRVSACLPLDMSDRARTVTAMTTTELLTRDAVTTLARYQGARQVLTAEYHTPSTPYDHSMHFTLHIEGGQHHGIVIHCATKNSVLRLFDEVLRFHRYGLEHPFLQAI